MVVFTSCEKETVLIVDQTSVSFTDAGGSQTVSLTTNKPWTASSNQSWCKVSPSGGEETSSSQITITCEANTSYDARNAAVKICCLEKNISISVIQEACIGLIIPQTEYNITNAAQQLEIKVQANTKFSVEVDGGCQEWISYNSTKGLTNYSVLLDISKNESYEDRDGIITISQIGTHGLNQVITIIQAPTSCIQPDFDTYCLSYQEQQININVLSNIDYVAQIEADLSWLKLVDTKGINKSVVSVIVENNPGEKRTGSLLLKGREITKQVVITQYDHREMDAVDLGLSVKWGKCNLGAVEPEDFGDFYAWGEYEPKARDHYTEDYYRWAIISQWQYAKYNTWDKLTTLVPQDDVAQILLGGKWRIPTIDEWTELINNCTMQATGWVSGSGYSRDWGYKLTSKINGNSIFLPEPGSSIYPPYSEGIYWSSSLYAVGEQNHQALTMEFYAGKPSPRPSPRTMGASIRPVTE